jgi:hypothetical protein
VIAVIAATVLRDVDALDPARGPIQAQLGLQFSEPRLEVLARTGLLAVRVLGVLRGHLDEAPLGPAARHLHVDAEAALLGQPTLEPLARLDLHREQQLVRDLPALAVVLADEARQELVVGERDPRELEGPHPVEVPAAHAQERDLDLIARAVEPDHVLVDLLHARDPLARAHAIDGPELIAVAGRLLVAQPLGGLAHAALEILDERVVPSVEEEPDEIDLREVRVAIDLEHARRRAALDLVLEARPRAPLELRVPASAQPEEAVDLPQRLPRARRRVDRPVVARAVGLGAPHHGEPRPRLARIDPYREKVLVVLELDVVAGLVLLDELVLEQRRLLLVADHVGREIGDLGLEERDERAHVAARRGEVAPHAALQAARLAHVEDGAARVAEEVDARRRGQGAELLLDVLGDHGTCDLYRAPVRMTRSSVTITSTGTSPARTGTSTMRSKSNTSATRSAARRGSRRS